MDQYITITSEEQNPCDFISNFVESVNIDAGYEVAVKSVFHAPVHNITEKNNKFTVALIRSETETVSYFEIPQGYYENTCDVVATMQKVLADSLKPLDDDDDTDVIRADPLIKVAPTFAITNNVVSLTMVHQEGTKRRREKAYFLFDPKMHGDAQLLRVLGYCSSEKMNLERIEVPQYVIENTIEAGFLYSSIVSNSMINQKQSRLLACLPIASKPGYNYYEVENPIYRPLSVHSFTDIHFALTDVNGEILLMNNIHTSYFGLHNVYMPTILTLHIRRIR